MKHILLASLLLLPLATIYANLTEIQSPEQFSQLLQANDIVIAEFYAPWCHACQQMARPLERVASTSPLLFTHINIEGPGLKSTLFAQYNVHSMPTLIVFKNGQQYKVSRGIKTESQLRRMVDELLTLRAESAE